MLSPSLGKMIAPILLLNDGTMAVHENGTEDSWSGDIERLPYAVGDAFVTNYDLQLLLRSHLPSRVFPT